MFPRPNKGSCVESMGRVSGTAGQGVGDIFAGKGIRSYVGGLSPRPGPSYWKSAAAADRPWRSRYIPNRNSEQQRQPQRYLGAAPIGSEYGAVTAWRPHRAMDYILRRRSVSTNCSANICGTTRWICYQASIVETVRYGSYTYRVKLTDPMQGRDTRINNFPAAQLNIFGGSSS